MDVLPAGPNALLAELADAADVPALYADLRRDLGRDLGDDLGNDLGNDLACRDLVPGARTVLLDGLSDLEAARSYLSAWRPTTRSGARVGEVVELPTTYDGEDLDAVARHWGMTRAEAVATHTGTLFTVAFVGFSPGFAYCTGLPAALAVPRLERPRAKVPAGSVGLADEFTGVYPSASPGGWRLIGRTDVTLWDATRDDPALLTPATRVRFIEA